MYYTIKEISPHVTFSLPRMKMQECIRSRVHDIKNFTGPFGMALPRELSRVVWKFYRAINGLYILSMPVYHLGDAEMRLHDGRAVTGHVSRIN